jgi:hypothetical protein
MSTPASSNISISSINNSIWSSAARLATKTAVEYIAACTSGFSGARLGSVKQQP